MLRYLFINNLAIVEKLEINFVSGLNIITGDSGAGKTIIIKALGLVLGDRGDSQLIRTGEESACVCASFDVRDDLQDFLAEQAFSFDDEILIKRIIFASGKSKSYINDHPVSVSLIKSIRDKLVNINNQHQNHNLQRKTEQLALLDAFGLHEKYLAKVKSSYQSHKEITNRITELETQKYSNTQLLEYQIAEFVAFGIEENDYKHILVEHTKLAKAGDLLESLNKTFQLLDNEQQTPNSILDLCTKELESIQGLLPETKDSIELIQQTSVILNETKDNISSLLHSVGTNPEKCRELDEKLVQFHSLARKHKIEPQFLLSHYQNLQLELQKHINAREKLEELNILLIAAKDKYTVSANTLSITRQKTIKKLTKDLTHHLKNLDLDKATFAISLETTDNCSPTGMDNIEFLISTNPGQAMQPIGKIASGGELARINLAITLATAQHTSVGSIFLDEIDTGVSGKTAGLVGESIYKLAQYSQVLCITHHPNVSSQPATHLHIEKQVVSGKTRSSIRTLKDAERCKVIASLISPDAPTPDALKHAEKLLNH